MQLPQRLAKRQEQQAAVVYGGRLVARSGSGDDKGDVETGDELIECKHTERQSFGLRRVDFFRHVRNSLLVSKRAVWEIEYTDPAGRNAHYAVVLERDEYLRMRAEIAKLWAKIEADC